jgi:hypothetical protein
MPEQSIPHRIAGIDLIQRMPKTLDFVPEYGELWGVNIVCREFNPALPCKFRLR